MNKELALNIIQLLSALESTMLIDLRTFPDYLHEQLSDYVHKLRQIVLED